MIQLFSPKKRTIDLSKHSHMLHGSVVKDFTEQFKQMVGAPYCVPVNSCTNAIERLLWYIEAEMCTIPSMIPPVVLNAVVHSGTKYVLTDNVFWVGGTYSIINDKRMRIVDSAQQFSLNQFKEIENMHPEKKVYLFHSFYPTKPIAGIDGGMISTNDEEAAKWLELAVMNGSTTRANSWERHFEFPGWKSYMSTTQAAYAIESLKEWPATSSRIRDIRDEYNKAFGMANTSEHLYRMPVSDKEEFCECMKVSGIMTGIHYEPTHRMPIYNEDMPSFQFPFTEEAARKMVTIPMHAELTDRDMRRIINVVLECR